MLHSISRVPRYIREIKKIAIALA